MTRKPNVLVTSAAGKTGLPATLQLLAMGHPVRAFVRQNDHRARRLKAAGAEVFVGNLLAMRDMRRALDGVQRAYHCAPTAPNGLHFSAVFAAAAAESELEHIVTLSQWLAHASHPSVFTREVWLTNRLLGLLPRTTLTDVNVGWFADNYFMVLQPAAQLGILPMPLGDGDEPKNAPPSNDDIAAVVAGALADPGRHAGQTYRPTGPRLLSPNEIAAGIGTALGRKVTYRDISEKLFLKAVTALRPANFNEATLTQLRIYAEEYRRGAFAVSAPTNAVETVTGRPAEDFAETARRVVSERPEARRTLRNYLSAVRSFAKIAITPAPDPDRVERDRDHPSIADPEFCRDSTAWLSSHASGAHGRDGLAALLPPSEDRRPLAAAS